MIKKHIKLGILTLLVSISQSVLSQNLEDSLIIDAEIVGLDSNQMDTMKIAGITIIFPKKITEKSEETTKNDKEVVKSSKRQISSFPKTKILTMQFGFTNFYAVKDFSASKPFGNLDLETNKSFNVNIGLIHKYQNIIGNNVRLIYGLGFDIYNLRFENKHIVLSSNPIYNILDSSTNYSKNKLVNTYLEIPLILSFNTNNKNRRKSFNIQAGVTGGYLIGAHTKVKTNSPRHISKERGKFNLNTYKLSAFAGLGYKNINVYAKYSLNPVFKTLGGSDIRNISFGINFRP